MPEFSRLRFKEMWKEEIIAFGPDLVQIITPFDPAAFGLTNALTRFTDQWARLNPFFKDSAGSVHTDDLTDLDSVRDSDLNGIKAMAKAYLYHRNAAKVDAAQLILNAMDGFDKNIPKQVMVVQTKTVTELVKVFETDVAVKAALVLLGLTEWVAPLKATNEEFNTIFLTRTREDGDKPDGNFLAEKPAAELALLNLLKVIDAKNTLDPDPKLDQMMSQINELISKYNQVVAQRKGGKAKDAPSPTPAP